MDEAQPQGTAAAEQPAADHPVPIATNAHDTALNPEAADVEAGNQAQATEAPANPMTVALDKRSRELYVRLRCTDEITKWFAQSVSMDREEARQDFDKTFDAVNLIKQYTDRDVVAEAVRYGYRYVDSLQSQIRVLMEPFVDSVSRRLAFEPAELLPKYPGAPITIENLDVPIEHALWIDIAGKDELLDLLMRLSAARSLFASIRTELELKERYLPRVDTGLPDNL
ncbi:hypothetical protein LTR56_001882 [Elasticomyces elasticus]|nr:hypothetical protein LTR56_001882 [Elasticomyces elasticus]KAK3668767.1 hypothetical protein LTR22_000247 [Elasticomyces elasticus]KAK4930607.1 hypothetical protein LTR49_003021 [Elasticomyces elasticus]KAK5757926.1 hypothetical protein LTS12_011965 [Elasticomyces elasticus]